MTDDFKEEVVTARNQNRLNTLYAVAFALAVVLGLHALFTLFFMLMSFNVFLMALCLISGALAVFFFVFKDQLKTEYEYAFSDGTLDFAKVLCGARRKELGSLSMQDVSACGYVKGEQARRFLSMQDAVRKNWFLNRDAELFFFYSVQGDKKSIVVIEPSEELVAMIKRHLPMGVYRDYSNPQNC